PRARGWLRAAGRDERDEFSAVDAMSTSRESGERNCRSARTDVFGGRERPAAAPRLRRRTAAGCLQTVAADLLVQRRARDAQGARRAGAVARVVDEDAVDVTALDLGECQVDVAVRGGGAPRGADLGREVDGEELVGIAGEEEHALEGVAELADVAGPGMGGDEVEG